jgi:hypothetical protein
VNYQRGRYNGNEQSKLPSLMSNGKKKATKAVKKKVVKKKAKTIRKGY